MELIEKYPQEDWIHIYTDGSKSEEGASGAGCYNESMGLQNAYPLGTTVTIVEAELKAIHRALTQLKQYNIEKRDIIIFSDSQSALSRLQAAYNTLQPPKATVRDIQSSIGDLQTTTPGRLVYLQWIPAHVGIPGNEKADKLAKQGAAEPQPTLPQPIELVLTSEQQHQRERWKEFWTASTVAPLYHQIGSFKATKQTAIDLLDRHQCGIIERLRLNRYPTASHLQRIGKKTNNLCRCKAVEDIPHLLLDCQLTENVRQAIWGPTKPTLKEMLFGNKGDLEKTCKFISKIQDMRQE